MSVTDTELRRAITRTRYWLSRSETTLAVYRSFERAGNVEADAKGEMAEYAELREELERSYDWLRLTALDRGITLPKWRGDEVA